MKDNNLPAIQNEEAVMDAPASFANEVLIWSRKCQMEIGIFLAGVETGVVAMTVILEIIDDPNSPFDLKGK